MREFVVSVRVLVLGLAVVALGVREAAASPIFWTNWIACSPCSTVSQTTATGTITTPTATVNVTYSNANGIGFFQNGVSGDLTNYYSGGTALTSPYTSTTVDNVPPAAEMIALQRAGSQTLTFSQTIANPVFAFVSLNGNGYSFLNQDFDILSVAGSNIDGQGVDACGYWGCGGVTKVVTNLPGGDVLYALNANNQGGTEPHGVIRFRGAFDTLTWNSTSNEYWNGITVGVQGTAAEVFDGPVTTPEPGTILLLGTGIAIGVARLRRKR